MNIQVFVSMNRKDVTHYIRAKAFDEENEAHQLIFDLGSYDLTGKEITLAFEPSGEITEPLTPDHGLVFVPVTKGLLKAGINKMQFTFKWAGKVEQSPVIQWEIIESVKVG